MVLVGNCLLCTPPAALWQGRGHQQPQVDGDRAGMLASYSVCSPEAPRKGHHHQQSSEADVLRKDTSQSLCIRLLPDAKRMGDQHLTSSSSD